MPFHTSVVGMDDPRRLKQIFIFFKFAYSSGISLKTFPPFLATSEPQVRLHRKNEIGNLCADRRTDLAGWRGVVTACVEMNRMGRTKEYAPIRVGKRVGAMQVFSIVPHKT
jgi:hypothetical protein